VGGVDVASLVLMVVLQALALALIMMIYGVTPRVPYILVRTPAELISTLLNLYLIAIIVQAILSWVNPGHYHPAMALLYSLTEPVMRPFRRLIPVIGGIDLSPLAALLAIQVAKMLILPPLNHVAPPFF
jgi:YggT family protein